MTTDSHELPQTVWAVSPAGELWGAGIGEPRLWKLSFTGETLRTISLADVATGSKRMELDNVSMTGVGSGGRIHVVASDAPGVEYLDPDVDAAAVEEPHDAEPEGDQGQRHGERSAVVARP